MTFSGCNDGFLYTCLRTQCWTSTQKNAHQSLILHLPQSFRRSPLRGSFNARLRLRLTPLHAPESASPRRIYETQFCPEVKAAKGVRFAEIRRESSFRGSLGVRLLIGYCKLWLSVLCGSDVKRHIQGFVADGSCDWRQDCCVPSGALRSEELI